MKEGRYTMDTEKIAQKLVSLRGNKSLKEVAEANGISISALSMYEAGNRIPRDEIKVRLAKYYGSTHSRRYFFQLNIHVLCIWAGREKSARPPTRNGGVRGDR